MFGVAYKLRPEDVVDTLAKLNHREKAGYIEQLCEVSCKDGSAIKALVYTATADNDHFLGEASMAAIAAQIARCVGPSGPNFEYLYNLHHSLSQHGESDSHVMQLYHAVHAIRDKEADDD